MRKFACLLGALVVVSMSLSAVAQTKTSDKDSSKWSVFGGYSYLHYNNGTNSTNSGDATANANGFVVSGAYNLTKMFAAVAEYGFYHAGTVKVNGTSANITANAETYLFGPKASFKTHSPVTPFAQVLIGGAHGNFKASNAGVTVTGPGANAFALALGGGLDWKVNRHFSIRPVQFDYLMTRFSNNTSDTAPRPGDGGNGTQNNFRYSAGVVYNF